MCIATGTIVKTNYGTGPYEIVRVFGPSTKPRGLDSINMRDPPPSPPHYNFTCIDMGRERKGPFYLNGYNLIDGRIKSVWDTDEIEIILSGPARQLSLFN